MKESRLNAVGTVARWVLRFALSGIFLYAGAVKAVDAKTFAESVASYRLLPEVLVTPVALGLPLFEVAAALLAMCVGGLRRVGAFCLLALMLVFTAAVASAAVRGLQIDCGCFGQSHFDVLSPSKNLWVALARDVALTVAAGFLYADALTKQSFRTRVGNENAPVARTPPGHGV